MLRWVVMHSHDSDSWLDMAKNGFRNIGLEFDIPYNMVLRQLSLLEESLMRIDRKWSDAIKKGTATKTTANRNINRLSRESMLESNRRIFLERQRQLYSQKSGKPIEAMMLSTTAAEPDLEHALLEGKVMPLDKVLSHLQRFGCQHAYKIIE